MLGTCLVDPAALKTAGQHLASDPFFKEGHRLIFDAFMSLGDRGEPVDLVTITAYIYERCPSGS